MWRISAACGLWVAFTCARSWRVSADDDEEVLGRGTHDGPEAPLMLLDVLYSIKIDVGSFSLSSPVLDVRRPTWRGANTYDILR